ncbi:proliferating cell nuclear antigen [Nematocida displodere]|uniref:DNA sliding clamp PCNA n=1 Tax=Nematocida displodere TaxID=1805483 RepID=A0A177EKN9_9MICR|nr:proliferating cell nuclear antigen [Nematocida displodere]
MFELKIGKSGLAEQDEEKTISNKCTFSFLKKILEGVFEIVKNSEMKITPEGLYIQAMDTMQVSMVDIFVKSSAFESFRCDKNLALGLPLQYILKIFRSLPVDGSTSILLSANDDATDLNITCEDDSKKYSSKIKLLDLAGEEYTFPSQEYAASIKLDNGEFQRVIKTLGAFGETLAIDATEKGFQFSQQSEVGNTEIFFALEEAGENSPTKSFQVRINDTVHISLPYKYMAIFGKFGSLGSDISISMTTGLPIHMTSQISVGYLNYYIAPRDDE